MRSVREIILARRSVRRYLPTPLSRETVEELLEAGRYAPSGHNTQAWRFTAILDQKLLQELNQLVRAGFAALALGEDAPKELRDAKAKAERQGESYHFTYDAPCLIIASNDTSDPNAQASCACALENMFLAACEMGLGSCWVNQLHWLRDDLNLRKKLAELGVPEAHTICGSGVFGHPDGKVPGAPTRKEGTWSIIG